MHDLSGAARRTLRARALPIDTHGQLVVYLPREATVVRAEGLAAHSRVEVSLGERCCVAVLDVVGPALLAPHEIGLSDAAWTALAAQPGAAVQLAPPRPLDSLGRVRARLLGRAFDLDAARAVMADVVAARYSDIELAALVCACAQPGFAHPEMLALTRAMVDCGARLHWDAPVVVDKHCVGGLPGNRTTMIAVPIVAAAGLPIPKTSSRSITSPAGTADTMEMLAPVALDLAHMRRVVEREGGCIVWGGAVGLSPADDRLIRIERALDLDSPGQLVASVLSKKAAAGATHVVLDLPMGPTAKVRSAQAAAELVGHLQYVAAALGLRVRCLVSDGSQPVGRGIGPALEARDVCAVLQGRADAPADLRERGLALAAALLELGGGRSAVAARTQARALLDDGRAWAKFQAICAAQGGMREPPRAAHTHTVAATAPGRIAGIDNRLIARVAKLCGAPTAGEAGLALHVRRGDTLERGQPLLTLHAPSRGEIAYALEFLARHPHTLRQEPPA